MVDARNTRQALWLVGVLLAMLSVLFIPLPSHTFLWKSINNFAHVPLFASVILVLVKISRMVFPSENGGLMPHYLYAWLGALALAILTEWLQTFMVTRQFELSDILHDMVGGMCGVGWLLSYEKSLSGKWARWGQPPHCIYMRVCVLIIILVQLFPTMEWARAYWDRASRFPSLLEFSSDWEMRFVQPSNSELKVVVPPVGWQKSEGDKVGHLLFHTTTYPGFRIEEPFPDWRGYSALRFDIFSELPTSTFMSIRIDDAHHNRTFEDRFNRRFAIVPGLNHIHVPMEDIRLAPKNREMDLSDIRRLLLFTVSPSQEFSLFVDSIRLE